MGALRGTYKQAGISAFLDFSSCAQAHGLMCVCVPIIRKWASILDFRGKGCMEEKNGWRGQ